MSIQTDYKEYTAEEYDLIQSKLKKPLGPEWLSQRTGPSGRLTYIEGRTAITIANDIFGFNGWSSAIKECTVDFVDVTENGRYNIGVSVSVRVTLKDGSYHEDVGYGSADNAKTKSMAFEKARKQAVTDATKRTLRYFGNALGNCLYDKSYLSGVGKMAHPQIKFSPQDLYRHTQYGSTPIVTKPAIQPTPKQDPIVKEERKVEKSDIITTLLHQPLVHEDSFTYEGDDAFFAEILENEAVLSSDILSETEYDEHNSTANSSEPGFSVQRPKNSDIHPHKKIRYGV